MASLKRRFDAGDLDVYREVRRQANLQYEEMLEPGYTIAKYRAHLEHMIEFLQFELQRTKEDKPCPPSSKKTSS